MRTRRALLTAAISLTMGVTLVPGAAFAHHGQGGAAPDAHAVAHGTVRGGLAMGTLARMRTVEVAASAQTRSHAPDGLLRWPYLMLGLAAAIFAWSLIAHLRGSRPAREI
ncbi:MAG TPA: hypothetical protein VEA19_05645 [Actinomycetota bacterium]|nr:hypothetical protein [Actinomycetota bacterium]